MHRTALRALAVGAAIAYVGALLWVYATVISPPYAYSGLVNRPEPDGSLEVAILVSLLPSLWLPIAITRPSQVLLWILYLLAYTPSILIPYLVLGTGFGGVFALTVGIFVSFACLSAMQGLRVGTLATPIRSMRAFENLVLALAVLLGAYIVLAYGVRLELPDIADVYDVRALHAQQQASSAVPFIAYATYWSLNVANPLGMLLGLRSRRYGMFALALGIEILIYGITGLKSAVFAVVLLVPLYALLADHRRHFAGATLAIAPLAVIAGALALGQLTGSDLATSLFVRRVIVVPGQLVAYYYDFFSDNPTYALGHSILSWFGPAPYALGPPQLIGAVYFGNPAGDPNANLWADAWANFGFAGAVTFTIVLGLVLRVLDGAAAGRDLRITGALAGFMGLILSNSGMLTTILTHGLGLAIVLIVLMPRQSPEAAAEPDEPVTDAPATGAAIAAGSAASPAR